MKKILGYSILTLIIVAVWSAAVFPQSVINALSSTQLQAHSWTFAALQSFTGVKLNATTQAVTPTGMKVDADTNTLDTYKDGVLATRIKRSEWTPPACADANGPMNGGSLCYYNGRLLFRDAAGVHALVGEVP